MREKKRIGGSRVNPFSFSGFNNRLAVPLDFSPSGDYSPGPGPSGFKP